MEGKRKSSDNDGQPKTKQARLETTRTSDVSSGQHSVEMDSAEIHETGDLLEGTVSKGSQREHASDSTESSSSESELEREKERLLAEEKRLTKSRKKQQLRAEIRELQASGENKKVKKQNVSFGMEGKSKSDNDKPPETTQARLDSLPEDTRTSYVSSVTAMSGGRAENCIITGQENHTCHHLQNLISETGLMINSMDASKHVSTHAEGAAYERLQNQGCVVIRGRSGSGKSHMGYTLLQRASKQFTWKPVKISSPDEWNYLPKSSNPKSDVAIDKYIVMIDDIFGSTNLIQHNLDQWRQKFDLVWLQVKSGQIWLVITTRPEIITQREASLDVPLFQSPNDQHK